jgi:hypothetical protein
MKMLDRIELEEAIATMELPLLRKELTPTNIRWLLRNMRISNPEHKKLGAVTKALKQLARLNLTSNLSCGILGTDNKTTEDNS